MVFEPLYVVTGPSMCLDTILDNMAVLLYEDELELST